MRVSVVLAFVMTLIAMAHATSPNCDCKGNELHGSLEDNSGSSSLNNTIEVLCATQYPQNCDDAVGEAQISGIYMIQIRNSPIPPFYIYCQADSNGGPAWAIVQRRQDGTIDFYRSWEVYKIGFGNLAGEYFIGLDKLHALTHATQNELWIEMKDFEGEIRNVNYDSFAVGNENEKYALILLGNYTGDAGGDSLRHHAGQMWSTEDVNNDINVGNLNCAKSCRGAWWYRSCQYSNLNGLYLNGNYGRDKISQGINWYHWHGYFYSLKYTHMAVRSKVI